jgi:hypothetical protein
MCVVCHEKLFSVVLSDIYAHSRVIYRFDGRSSYIDVEQRSLLRVPMVQFLNVDLHSHLKYYWAWFVGAVVEAKAQLIAIRDRVSVDGGNATSDNITNTPGESKRKITAANPGPEDAADLLR